MIKNSGTILGGTLLQVFFTTEYREICIQISYFQGWGDHQSTLNEIGKITRNIHYEQNVIGFVKSKLG